ncbi:glycosyltransferase family A protein [Rhizobium sp. CNPSo 4039]|uniref:glycosyltransferase family 2 protein n=1 Tax=Rhizobium sp. CNPSo 4039 TaxID=3021409 RepID=UPI00254AF528|nr:glycosyltransferase family A protein [Rhizobium sp. CNPSo 4039]MDK4716519.1 glycosyltransferase family A protein [Rhizobium sp. CNPSo 4039]
MAVGAKRSTTVAVVVPMFNAERTIGATLASICRQTHQELDIIIVDDGSSDRSFSIVAEYARQDPRIRILRQANSGVAVARNNGAAATDAEFLAFIDADDLWAPSKIALQWQALDMGGPSVGLAYCWYALIDEHSRVFSLHNRPSHEGHVLQRMCRNNFVGNGSSMLMRRSAFEDAGQFDPSLRARNAQGCEDLLICLRIAENYEFRVIPQHLIGYRMTNTNMSSDVRRMLSSCEIVLAEYREKYPQYGSDLDAHLVDMIHWLVVRAFVSGRLFDGCDLLRRFLALEPRLAISSLPNILDVYCRARLVPDWLKARLRGLQRNAELRPLYMETIP